MTLLDTAELPCPQQVLLIGGSTRAAAFSARRAGFNPICIDMFADADLQAIADVRPVRRYPDDVAEAAGAVDPAVPWLYTGGIENHPRIVTEISSRRPLWGNDAASLRHARDPAWVRDTLRRANLPALDAIVPGRDFKTDPPPPDGRWLLKPLRGAGGRGICLWNAAATRSTTLAEPHYFQQHVAGDSIGALFLAFADRAEVIAITRQLAGRAEFDAVPFAYCGSIGPIRLSDAVEKTIRRVGETFREAASLRGLFGCDFVFDGQTPWLVEVNPRYTASAEIIELATGWPLLEWHRRACASSAGTPPFQEVSGTEMGATGSLLPVRTSVGLARSDQPPVAPASRLKQCQETPAPLPQPLSPCGGDVSCAHHSPFLGKAILYSDHELTAPAWPRRVQAESPWHVPFLADIPPAGAKSSAGWPLCTVFAQGDDVASVEATLRRRVRRVRSRFLETGSAGG